jgi:hypothetical protein
MPMARRRCTKTGPYEVSRSLMRYRAAWSHGNASVIWREIHSAVGLAVTPNDTQSHGAQNDKTVEDLETNCWQHEEVDRRDTVGMILEKRPPALRGWPEAAAHIPRDRRLGDLEAEHQQLTMNARRAPEQVFFAHSSDQIAQFSREPGSANPVAW